VARHAIQWTKVVALAAGLLALGAGLSGLSPVKVDVAWATESRVKEITRETATPLNARLDRLEAKLDQLDATIRAAMAEMLRRP
jgi:outer membrane murein-binding lipoprotein Lpp